MVATDRGFIVLCGTRVQAIADASMDPRDDALFLFLMDAADR
jgi:hypothetical protein